MKGWQSINISDKGRSIKIDAGARPRVCVTGGRQGRPDPTSIEQKEIAKTLLLLENVYCLSRADKTGCR
jgi:hypothetical protein